MQVLILTGAFARSFFRRDWFTDRLHSSTAALDRHWSIVTLLPVPDSGSAQDRILQALADAGRRNIEDTHNFEPECNRPR